MHYCILKHISIASTGMSLHMQGAVKKPGGTPLYVAPEQFMQTVGLESDMWSLGMLFFQLLCGRLPFADSFKGKSPMDVMMVPPPPLPTTHPHPPTLKGRLNITESLIF